MRAATLLCDAKDQSEEQPGRKPEPRQLATALASQKV